nr:PREDICTED: alcohol dehydrogenase [NADP(+)] B-like isoform X1 [Bemisia tabaci]
MKMKGNLIIICVSLAANFQYGNAVEKFKLSSGHEIPAVGLGTSWIKLTEMDEAIANALEMGYRHIDTAFQYLNEAAIGAALKKWFQKGGKREDLFITSKLPTHGNRAESVEKYLKQSLKDLDLDYVDMYLIHKPFGFKEGENMTEVKENGKVIFENVDHLAVWKKMEEQVTAGRVKSIGLSNFNQTQILNIYINAEIKPSNLQVEWHAFLQQRELLEFCKKYNIVMTAYSPLGSPVWRGKFHNGTDKSLPRLTDLPEIKEIAKKYNKTAAQILLRHTVQAGLAVIPKSSNKDRQRENIEIFDFSLSGEDVEKINGLNKGEMGRVFDFVYYYEGIDKNPQYPFATRAV